MTNDMSGALARLNRDRALYANLLEVLRRGSARVCRAGERGILLYDEASGAWMMSAADQAAAGELLALVSGGCDLFVGHETFYLRSAEARLGFSAKQICYSALYPGVEPLAVPAFDGTVRRLGPEWAPWLVEHYENDFGGLPYMQGALRRGMLGAFLEGEREPAGFVGFHEEGSIGLWRCCPTAAVWAWGRSSSAAPSIWRWSGGNWLSARCSTPTRPPWPSSAGWGWSCPKDGCSGLFHKRKSARTDTRQSGRFAKKLTGETGRRSRPAGWRTVPGGSAGRPPGCSGSGRPLPGPGRKRTRQTPAGRPVR